MEFNSMSSDMYLWMVTEPDADLDALLAALSRVRGRGPRLHGDHGHDGPHGHPGRHAGPPWLRGEHPHPFGPHARLGGAPARMRLLDVLTAADGPMSVSDLAAAIGVDQPRASRLVQQAVELGLVAREADPADARRTRIALTATGRGRVGAFRDERRDRLSRALAEFSAQERADLVRLVGKLAASWPQD
ncbi:MarR family winged helix-turn-helix transcriptional regulator [Microbacterium dauci]|uniref:MarR family winged helix-turn-helix transcriptional regulator n=1 Tax=Microbacterium dauci TaxID=3048008 RepID=A0ABT6ZDG1_9MICO|nr:MarR family winged helix-turn-helix transcriptional regulator [Microbacterium sp. LX3-4]MDJ1114201.1 MarR family winged helix-turn-helix transcriptional regulator [Microbacterium sp. LX3-4]